MLLRISVVTLRVAVLTADLVAFFAALPSEVLLFLVVVFLAVELLEVLLFDVDDFLVLLPPMFLAMRVPALRAAGEACGRGGDHRAEDGTADAGFPAALAALFFFFPGFGFLLFFSSLALGFFLFLDLLVDFGQDLVGAFAVEIFLVVLDFLRCGCLDVHALARCDGADLAEREEDFGAFHDARCALLVEEGYQGFTRAQVEDGVFGLEGGIGAEGLCGGAHGFLVLRRIGAQGVLDAVAQLGQDADGHVARDLGDEIDADALGTDQADDLLDLGGEGLGSILEEHVGLVEEEDELREVQVTDLREGAVELGKKPQQEGRVELRLEHQLVGGEDVHHTLAPLALQEVVDIEGRLAEELVGALALQAEEGALDGADRSGGDIAVLGGIFRGILADEIQHGPQVLQVDQQEAVVVGDLEDDVQDTGLGLIEFHQAAQSSGTAGPRCRTPAGASG